MARAPTRQTSTANRQMFLPKHCEIKEIPQWRHAQQEDQGGVHGTSDRYPPAVQRPRENNQHPQGDQRQYENGTRPRRRRAGTSQQEIRIDGED